MVEAHREAVEAALREHLTHRSLLTRCMSSPDRLNERWVAPVARDLTEVALDALKAAGYTLVRPVTAEEEAGNQW